MGVLKNFESRLERGIEGFFTKAFRSGLHPVELAKRIIREGETHKTVGVKEVWLPNRYVLRVSSDDRERFSSMEKSLQRELETVVTESAKEHGYGLVARPEVVFETDERMKRGDLRVEAEISEDTGPAPREDTAPPPETREPAKRDARPAVLRLVDGDKEFSLEKDRAVIGRLAGSEVEIQDPGASRRHAEVRRQGGKWVLVDLGSTNGTMVNDAPVAEQILRDGDRITIGRTVLEFRRR